MSRVAIRNVKSTGLFVHGSVLERGDDLSTGSPTYTVITNTTTVGLPVGISVERLDSTVLSSPDFTMEGIPGLVEQTAVPFTIRFNPADEASHRTLQAASSARSKVAWRVTIPHTEDPDTKNGASWVWDGWISSLDVPEAGSSILEISGSIEVAGAVSYTQQAA